VSSTAVFFDLKKEAITPEGGVGRWRLDARLFSFSLRQGAMSVAKSSRGDILMRQERTSEAQNILRKGQRREDEMG